MTNVEINTTINKFVLHRVLNVTTVVEKNHFAKVCRTRSITKYHKKVHSVLQHDSFDASDELFIDMVKCSTNESSDWKVTLLVNDQKTRFKIDTGAQCNVISSTHTID